MLVLEALTCIDLQDAARLANKPLLFEMDQRVRYASAAQSQSR